MARLKRPTTENENPNPATKFLHWKSNDKCFSYYDKEKQENVEVQLPLKLLFLEHYHTVKGWSDSANSGIWSNEVYAISKEPLIVRNSAGIIAEGIYSEKRTEIVNAGGKYHRSIYCMTEDGEIINLQLKGATIGGIDEDTSVDKQRANGWSTFYGGDRNKKIKGVSHLLDNQFITIDGVKEGKKGAVKFCIPDFQVGEVISREVDELANKAVDKLQAYMDEYFNPTKKTDAETLEDKEEVVEAVSPEDLPF